MGFVDGPRRVFINRIATSGRHIGSQGCHIAPHRHVPPGKLQGCHPSGATSSRSRLTSRVTCPAAAVMLRLKQGCRLPPSCTGRGPAAKLNDCAVVALLEDLRVVAHTSVVQANHRDISGPLSSYFFPNTNPAIDCEMVERQCTARLTTAAPVFCCVTLLWNVRRQ